MGGAPKGHRGGTDAGPPDRTVVCTARRCPSCGSADLEGAGQRVKDIVEIPKVRAEKVRNVRLRHVCGGCGSGSGAGPRMLRGTGFGPRAVAAMCSLRGAGVSLDKISRLMKDATGVRPAKRSVYTALQAAAGAAGPAVDGFWTEARGSGRSGTDETPAPVDGRPGWARVVVAAHFAGYFFSRHRSAAALVQLLPDRDMIAACDGYAAYRRFRRIQRCRARVLRRARRLADDGGPGERALYGALCRVYDCVREARPRAGSVPEREIAALAARIAAAAGGHDGLGTDEGRRTAVHVRNAAPDLPACLRHPGVPPNNNGPELSVRKVKRLYDAIGCLRTEGGMRMTGTLMTFYETLRAGGRNPAQALRRALESPVQASWGRLFEPVAA